MVRKVFSAVRHFLELFSRFGIKIFSLAVTLQFGTNLALVVK